MASFVWPFLGFLHVPLWCDGSLVKPCVQQYPWPAGLRILVVGELVVGDLLASYAAKAAKKSPWDIVPPSWTELASATAAAKADGVVRNDSLSVPRESLARSRGE